MSDIADQVWARRGSWREGLLALDNVLQEPKLGVRCWSEGVFSTFWNQSQCLGVCNVIKS
eukprot:320799-Pelagomonas_calceolata.AAC.3